MTDIRIQKYNCARCGGVHNLEIDYSKLAEGQKLGKEPLMDFNCPDVALMYRVTSFAIDTRVAFLKESKTNLENDSLKQAFKEEWGIKDFDKKLDRYIELDLAFFGIVDEYYDLLSPVVSSYCCGLFYPAMTSCGALGERILNRLILKTRDYFKSSPHYKKIYRKKSFDQWDGIVEILLDWNVISNEVAGLFLKLKSYRNDSIHYNNDYDFEKNAHDALKIFASIIDKLFNYVNRKDLFWVFDVPGEIWLRSSVLDQPFVKEFVLSHCLPLTPYCEPFATPPIKGTNAPVKPITDKEFMEIRINKGK